MRTPFAIRGHPIHPMLVPIPIGLFVWSLISDIVYLRSGDPTWFTMSFWSAVAGVLSGLLAAVPGFGDYIGRVRHTSAAGLALWHLVVNLTMLAAFGVSILLMGNVDLVTGEGFGVVFALHVLGTLALFASGWLGGEMVYRHRVAVLEDERRAQPAAGPEHREPAGELRRPA
jgi:uncharacterized membrane protein